MKPLLGVLRVNEAAASKPFPLFVLMRRRERALKQRQSSRFFAAALLRISLSQPLVTSTYYRSPYVTAQSAVEDNSSFPTRGIVYDILRLQTPNEDRRLPGLVARQATRTQDASTHTSNTVCVGLGLFPFKNPVSNDPAMLDMASASFMLLPPRMNSKLLCTQSSPALLLAKAASLLCRHASTCLYTYLVYFCLHWRSPRTLSARAGSTAPMAAAKACLFAHVVLLSPSFLELGTSGHTRPSSGRGGGMAVCGVSDGLCGLICCALPPSREQRQAVEKQTKCASTKRGQRNPGIT